MAHGMTAKGVPQRISEEDLRRVREICTTGAEADSPLAHVVLRMMDGEPINDACAAEGTNLIDAMRQWHEFADRYGIVVTDGQRACIHVLACTRKADA